MTTTVENLEKLERRMTLTVPLDAIRSEVDTRLKQLARTVKMDGFRPGKVPVSVVAKRFGGSIRYEVMNDRVGEAFATAANEANLKVAGQPRITEKENASAEELAFDAVFEVFPEVRIGDLATAEIEKVNSEVDDAAVDRTIDILRRQRRTFSQRAQDAAAQDEDRVTIDFEGKIDGEPFEGGRGDEFQFVLGEGQMLKEFEDAVRGMKIGESKTFPLAFPADYHGKDVAGKQADFLVTLKKIEASHLPEVDDALAKALGIADATVDGLRADIRKNLEREVRQRVRSPQQGRGDAGADREFRTGPAQDQRAVRTRSAARVRARRTQAARHEGCRQDSDPRRCVSRAGRAPGPARARGRRTGAAEQPGSQARTVALAHRGTRGEL